MSDDTKKAAETPARAKRDNRVILKGVRIGGKTFSGDSEETLDELEAAMSPRQYDRLRATGSLEGDWKPSGEDAQPMVGSRMEKAQIADSTAAVKQLKDKQAAAAKADAEKAKAAESEAKETAKANPPAKTPPHK